MPDLPSPPLPASPAATADRDALPRLSGVVVHWGDPAPLAALAAAWPDDPRFELVVVDNGPFPAPPGDTGAGGAEHPAWAAVRRRGRVVSAGRNLGFAGGANAGVREAAGELLLILNSDARPEAGALDALLAGFDRHPEAAGLAPRLIGDGGGEVPPADHAGSPPEEAEDVPAAGAPPAGEPQYAWQLRDLPTAGQLLLHALGVPAASEARREPAAGEPVEQPAAAALALRREVFEAAGGFDPGFHPAWFEDVDLAARLADAGRPLLYWPEAVFRHVLGGTVGQLGYGRFLWTYQRNLVRYLGKHHGRAAAALARLLLPGGLLLRLALLPLRRPRRAASRVAAATGLLGALAGALTGWRRPAAWRRGAAGERTGERLGERTEDRRRRDRRPPAIARPGADWPPPGWDDTADPPRVAVCMVTRDSRPDLADCFAAVAALEHRPLEVVLVDCASGDGTPAEAEARRGVLEEAGVPLAVLPLEENRGFAGGMNVAVAAAPDADWILSLNADARPDPDYVSRLLARAAAHPEMAVGAVTGRLVRPLEESPATRSGRRPPADAGSRTTRRLDACGMLLTRTWRHLDRGSGEPDRSRYAVAERVFGATGAASLFRRMALSDAALLNAAPSGEPAAAATSAAPGPSRPASEAGRDLSTGGAGGIAGAGAAGSPVPPAVFDPLFHSFREDAELAFRLRERGWEILYEPAARAEHRRFNLPSRRAAMPSEVNRRSLQNRYLLRLYHQTAGNAVKTLLPTLARDLIALAYVLLRERTSLPAYAWLWRHRHRLVARRRAIQARRRLAAADLDAWFGASGFPLPATDRSAGPAAAATEPEP